MATPMNFQSLNFGNISQKEAEARRRYYDSIGSIGGVISSTGDKVGDYLQRKQREAEDKKKWDNMIAQQEYQKEQDRLNKEYRDTRDNIADTRYDNEYGLKLDEIRKNEEKLKKENEALVRYREGLKKSYTPEFLAKYGPTAQADYEAAMTAPTLAEAVASGRNLGQGIYQKDLMDFQREQNAANEKRDSWMREADELVASVDDRAARNGIDLSRSAVLPNDRDGLEALRAELEGLRDYLNTAPRHSVNSAARVGAINAQIAEINRRLGPKPKRKWE
jgi:hypothetical protein